MFEHFKFSSKQLDNYIKSAKRDLQIATDADVPEVAFRFCYDALLKLAIVMCAKEGLRVKSRKGHHIELITKLSEFLKDKDIEVLANEMRAKRNWDLYGGGASISSKEADGYVKWVSEVFQKAEGFLNGKQQGFKI